MKKTILLGNGFDLALNIKTSYKDFIESSEYNNSMVHFKNIGEYIRKRMKDNYLWSGIESDLLSYIEENIEQKNIKREPGLEDSFLKNKPRVIESFKKEFEHLKLALNEYLLNIQNQNRACMPKVDKKIKEIIHGASDISVYSFNFTNFYKRFFDSSITKIFHLHDCLKDYDDTNIIFGIESDELDCRLYDFITKSLSHNYKYYI
ncbi:MAG: AbiH family protein, partial [Chitinophagales bacterium]